MTFGIKGKVIHGEGKARFLGFPTANLHCSRKLEKGVYGVKVKIGERQFEGIMNISNKPTFHHHFPISKEIHIFDFDKQIYGETIEAEIAFFIRAEQRFTSSEDLISQVKEDVADARTRFAGITIRLSG